MDNNSYSHNDGKFCFLWDRLKAQYRYKRYSPLLAELDERYDVYHVLLTIIRSWNAPFTYDDFCCLSFALENIPVYELYGCFSCFGLFEGD